MNKEIVFIIGVWCIEFFLYGKIPPPEKTNFVILIVLVFGTASLISWSIRNYFSKPGLSISQLLEQAKTVDKKVQKVQRVAWVLAWIISVAAYWNYHQAQCKVSGTRCECSKTAE